MNKDNIDPTLWKLINSKDFDSLTDSEKSFVSSLMSKENYTEWRKASETIGGVYERQLEKHGFPKEALKQRIDKKFRQKQHQSRLTTVVNFPVPLWQMAASWTIFFLCTGWYFQYTKPTISNPLKIIAQTDTVFIQSAMALVRDTIFIQPQIAELKIQQTSSIDSIDFVEKVVETYESDVPSNTGGLHISGFEDQQPKGQSLKEDSVAEKFMVGVM